MISVVYKSHQEIHLVWHYHLLQNKVCSSMTLCADDIVPDLGITTCKNVRVTLTSQWGWRHTHINDTEGNVIYPPKWVPPIYTMYKWHSVRSRRKCCHNILVVSQWVTSQKVTSQWPRPRSAYSALSPFTPTAMVCKPRARAKLQ